MYPLWIKHATLPEINVLVDAEEALKVLLKMFHIVVPVVVNLQ
jgi:hypothetical protein